MAKAKKLEKDIERKVCRDALTYYGVPNKKLESTSGETGWPDRAFFVGFNRILLIEFKRPGEVLEPKQEYMITVLRELGYDVQVHDTVEGALSAIRAAKLEAAQVSRQGGEVHPKPPSRRAAAGPRSR